jgi:arginase family enzyme
VPVTTEILESSGRACSEVKASFELIRQVSARVRAAVEDGAFPVVLSGSCFAALGVMAGVTEPSPAVVWLDAHADFNTPETTVFAAPRAHGDGQIVTPADRRPASVRSQHN